jgi:hypothetical protein
MQRNRLAVNFRHLHRALDELEKMRKEQSPLSPLPVTPSDDGNDAYSIESFCRGHGISKATFYKRQRQGLAPPILKGGKRILIAKEAAAAWRAGRR